MTEQIPPQDAPAEAAAEEKKKISPFLIVGLVILGVSLAGFVGLAFLPGTWLAHLRDVSIVFFSVLVFVCMALLIYLVASLVLAVNRLSDRVDTLLQQGSDVLDQVKGTATAVKGTAGFVGERIASPFVRVGSWAAGIGTGVRGLVRGRNKQEVHDE